MDFVKIIERSKRTETEVYPDFQTGEVTDLLGRGKSFYAVWDEANHIWSTNENDVQRLVDEELWDYVEKMKARPDFNERLNVKTLKSDSSGMWARFSNYIRRFPDSGIQLDNKLTFLSEKTRKKDYASKRLPYDLEEGDWSAWDKLVSQLYDPKEREKIEWAIGSIVSGDSRKIEKFCALYGAPGTGKGTILKVITRLFPGYYVTFDAKALGSSNNQFATEVFRSNPLVAIQGDSDMSHIEDNTKINSIVSHEMMVINEKNKPQYMGKANCFLFIGTNRPVKITDGNSGIIRRLIDISPKNVNDSPIPPHEYDTLMSQIDFQLGAIAKHCLDVYRSLGKNYYKNYRATKMQFKTDPFYNFVEYYSDKFKEQSYGVGLTQAFSMYKEYCDESNIPEKFRMMRPTFREELKNYFKNFDERTRVGGEQVRNWYSGFLAEKLEPPVLKKEQKSLPLVMDSEKSLLDDILTDCPAQYGVDDGNGNEKPMDIWGNVETTLKDLNTKKVHFVRVPKNHIVIDFDIKNEKGEKDVQLNAEAASKFPPTYAEYSKGGSGIHLHYIYDGDVDKLCALYDDNIEIKVFRGKAALRRRLSKCNDIPIAHLAEGSLPIKEEKSGDMLDLAKINDANHLRNKIAQCLRKETKLASTTQNINLIFENLENAYNSGMDYDVSDMEPAVLEFAMNATNQWQYCIKKVNEMHFKGKEREKEEIEASKPFNKSEEIDDSEITFFDIEIYPPGIDDDGEENEGLFLICYKKDGNDEKIVSLPNPKPHEVEKLTKKWLAGFNNRDYDNHMVYGSILGYSNAELYDLSRRIIVEKAKGAKFPEAYDISYTDIFDFASTKQSLKKWEIELGISHIEMGIPWDKPAPKRLWEKIIDYCKNDVKATEAVFHSRQVQEDWKARKILARLGKGKVNDTTNTLTTRIIFGKERHPNLVYTDLKTGMQYDMNGNSWPSPRKNSFPEYEFVYNEKDKKWHNIYRGVDVGKGGWVYSDPGIYTNVALLDVASLHPTSIIELNKLGEYTQRYADLKQARVLIKHKDFDGARKLFDGALSEFLENESQAKALSKALKLPLNSFYGISAATYDNPARDPRDKNNIIALRGALFMKTLFDAVEEQGFHICHVKTDSVKVPNATPEIIKFIQDFAKEYGYEMEHEATYERICLIDKAQYVATFMEPEECEKRYGYIPGDNADHFAEHSHPWTTTGDEFQRPYIFKTLFSGEPIEFKDMCVTNSVREGAIFLDKNEGFVDVTAEETERDKRKHNAAHPDKPHKLNKIFENVSDEDLEAMIANGHNYEFVGRVGRFFPVKKGSGGCWQVVNRDGKYSSVSGAKGYRWLEAEVVKELGMEDKYDPSYHDNQVTEAIKAIEKFGSYEKFVDISKPYAPDVKEEPAKEPDDDPPWSTLPPVVPCGDGKFNTCLECPFCKDDICGKGYSLASYVEHGGSGV